MRMTIGNVMKALGEARLTEAQGASPCSSKAMSMAPESVTGVSTDTRSIKPGDLFVALKSEKVDGHDFIGLAVAAGAGGVVVSRPMGALTVPVFVVEDTLVAYGQLARWWRDRFDIPVVGVTGSVGKTTTKEMLAAALAPLGPILKTDASQNNEAGVPKTLLTLGPEHKAAVIEMGMRGAGQIAYLCGIARPTAGIISLIAENHIELLGSLDAIADAKGELMESLTLDGTAFLNAGEPFFSRLAVKTRGRLVAFGVVDDRSIGDVLASDHPDAFIATDVWLRNGCWSFRVGNQKIALRSPAKHDVSNALAAYAVAVTLGVNPADAAVALSKYEPMPMRMQIVTPTTWGGSVINDAYNAAPASMRSALETLAAYTGNRKIAFLGDMKELGEVGPAAHREIGVVIEALGGLDEFYTVGDLAALIPGATRRFASSDAAALFASDELALDAGDVVLVKGSRAMAMEKVATALSSRGPAHGL